jgi:hypothetical protein
MAIFMGCVFFYVIILTMIGPEKRTIDPVKEAIEHMDAGAVSDVEKAAGTTEGCDESANRVSNDEIKDGALDIKPTE